MAASGFRWGGIQDATSPWQLPPSTAWMAEAAASFFPKGRNLRDGKPASHTPSQWELWNSGILFRALAMCSEMILNVLYHFGHDTATLTSDSEAAQNFGRPLLTSWCTPLPNSLLYQWGQKLRSDFWNTVGGPSLSHSFLPLWALDVCVFSRKSDTTCFIVKNRHF